MNAGTSQKQVDPRHLTHYSMVFSVVVFAFVIVVGGAIFMLLKRQIVKESVHAEIARTLDNERVKIDVPVGDKVDIALKMAQSPNIRRHFADPSDQNLEKEALEEIAVFRRVLDDVIFWVNDIDKKFYFGDAFSYVIDPDDTTHYWYKMTLYETERYNFNINYNPEINEMMMWINVPVFDPDSARRPIGMLGTGIDISVFIDAVYKNYKGVADLYFFNRFEEITAAKDTALVTGKRKISEAFGEVGTLIAGAAKGIAPDEYRAISTPMGEVGICVIPSFEWYAFAVAPNTIQNYDTGMTWLFIMMVAVIGIILAVFHWFITKLSRPLEIAMRDLEETSKYESELLATIQSSIRYASRIQTNLLPKEGALAGAFADHFVIWKPRDVVGGDIYWVKEFEEGTALCVCDCTGHGVPGALLTTLVVSALESIAQAGNCRDTAAVLFEIDRRLASVFSVNDKDGGIKDGCDLALLFVGKDGRITLSSGNASVFVCDGETVTRFKGQNIYIGEGLLKSKAEVNTVNIPANPKNKIYIATDGLFDQPGGETGLPFGYERFKRLIQENHNKPLREISNIIWASFEEHLDGEARVDDFQIIAFAAGGRI